MSSNFDLFDDPVPASSQPPTAQVPATAVTAAPAAPVPVAEPARTSSLEVSQLPTALPGVENHWTYRGVVFRCNPSRAGLVDHWETVEPLGSRVEKADRRVQLCKAIDAYLARDSAPDGRRT